MRMILILHLHSRRKCIKRKFQTCYFENSQSYAYIGVRVNAELYDNIEIRQMCNLLSRDDLREARDRVSDILYTSSFGRKSDPIMGYVTLTLQAPNPVGLIAPRRTKSS